MVSFIFQALITFFLTAIVGTWISSSWQGRAAKEQRYYDFSRLRLDRMDRTISEFTAMIGQRIYLLQRLILNARKQDIAHELRLDLSKSIVAWNEKLIEFETVVRRYFEDSYLRDLERFQESLAATTASIIRTIDNGKINQAKSLDQVAWLRNQSFQIIGAMTEEHKRLDREMHFGIYLEYDAYSIESWSTYALFKALFMSREQSKAIVGSPTNFGKPVRRGEAGSWID